MKWLTKISSVQVATVVGQFALHRDPDLERFAESLIKFNPSWQRLALEELLVQVERLAGDRAPPEILVGEDRPGKFVRIEPRSQALRYISKKFAQTLARESDIRTRTLLAEVGWGAGSLILEPDGPRQIACCEFDISGRELQLAAAEQWGRRIQEWITSVSGLSIGNIPKIEISTPYLVIAGYLAELLATKGKHFPAAPDFVWGWHPLLTLLDFLSQAAEPSLLINLHHGSGLQIVLVW